MSGGKWFPPTLFSMMSQGVETMFIVVARYTGRTRISATILDMVTHEELILSRSWVNRKNGKVKEVRHIFPYANGELSTGRTSVELGLDCVINLNNGKVESVENPNSLSFGLC